MNNHIEQLAEQVDLLGDFVPTKIPGRYAGIIDISIIEKFAELIVRECLDIIQKEVSLKYKDGSETEEFMGGHYAGSLLARGKIKSHFGFSDE